MTADRTEKLREARKSPHVSLAEYLKLRAKSKGIILIFEGKQCPTVYIGWLTRILQGRLAIGGQIIARGKRNVLALRDLISKNPRTAAHKTLYFVDKDFDYAFIDATLSDVYITRGHSIENELISWAAIESFLRAHFDIANSEDDEDIQEAHKQFDVAFQLYLAESREVQRIIYTCRQKRFGCTLRDSIAAYVEINWTRGTVRHQYETVDDLLTLLKVDPCDAATVRDQLRTEDDFSKLDPILDWRGKFHFNVVRSFLMFLRDARCTGTPPFRRAVKLSIDASQEGLMGLLGGLSPCPPCLIDFVEKNTTGPTEPTVAA